MRLKNFSVYLMRIPNAYVIQAAKVMKTGLGNTNKVISIKLKLIEKAPFIYLTFNQSFLWNIKPFIRLEHCKKYSLAGAIYFHVVSDILKPFSDVLKR